MGGKSAIITGAARGIGLEVARVLAQAGASVALVDVDEESAEAAAAGLRASGYIAMSAAADVSNRDQVQAMVAQVFQQLGRIDILINNAGVCPITTVGEISADEWDFVLGVNLKGAFLCSQAVIPLMRRQRAGKIVNIASSAGQMGGLAVGLHYTASKAGLLGLTKGLARILAPDIQVNAVSPGTTESEMTRGWSQEAIDGIVRGIPAGRLGQPADVAAAVRFLASVESDFITGQTLSVNGGLLMA
ncbi:MAG: 3-oxoacyl-ACP reductase family protein [Chloroflexota bacterium]|jgi:3-oxoacyl-[acyl-carrier protein] reductase